ncbi:MAG: transposase [Thermoflexaceae bacterium]|nr:transposase [Thermoflexaceae bacterium]
MSRRRPRRTFTAEYKAEVVAMYRTTDKTVTEIAKELDLTESAVSRWVTRRGGCWRTFRADHHRREELAYLRRENRVLREERDILKRATAFFAKETR